MANELNLARILVSLDTLLDTRLATLARINIDGVEPLLKAGYCNRQVDFFPGYDTVQFKEMYDKRDVDTLMLAVETKMVVFLRQMVDMLDDQTIVRAYHTGVEVVVNYFPYDLDEENKVVILETVQSWTNNLAAVKLVSLDNKDLTPEHCKDQYSAMIMYHFDDWLRMHAQQMAETRLVDVTLYAPPILKHADEKTHEDDLEKFERTVAHPLEALELLTKMLIGLQIVDTNMFSIADISGHISSSSPSPVAVGEGGDEEHE